MSFPVDTTAPSVTPKSCTAPLCGVLPASAPAASVTYHTVAPKQLSESQSVDPSLVQPSTRPALLDGLPLTAELQWYVPPRRPYTRRELLADRLVNFAGAGLAWVLTLILGLVSWGKGDDLWMQIGFWLQGAGMIIMLNLSALYHHWSWDWKNAHWLLSFDHIGISSMIMGTYTPIMLYVGTASAYGVLALVWTLGIAGIVAETCRQLLPPGTLDGGAATWGALDIAHVVRYLVMGWACILIGPSIMSSFPPHYFVLPIAGGLLYTFGVLIFIRGQMEFHMAIWHAFVLGASLCFYSTCLFFLTGVSHGKWWPTTCNL